MSSNSLLGLEEAAALEQLEASILETQVAIRHMVGQAVAANMRPDAIHALAGLYETSVQLFSSVRDHIDWMRNPEDDDATDDS